MRYLPREFALLHKQHLHSPIWTQISLPAGQYSDFIEMAAFLLLFQDFVQAQKIEDLSESKNFSAEVFQITIRFVLAKKF